ncbi:hypothetical protein OsI_30762 [Oryza sativa Indica Group]|uniref:Uncharacterized protein n=1 Tax=Oryza sativa subsp. indica TaxID=39946 RepID=A2YZH9_ORYSI|nr:hypothetical protein OsI_30762 [Oryza sativa Indica Group]
MAEGRNNKVADGGGFGMVLLEMRTGMRALDTGRPALQHSLVEWAKPYLADRRKLAWLIMLLDGFSTWTLILSTAVENVRGKKEEVEDTMKNSKRD